MSRVTCPVWHTPVCHTSPSQQEFSLYLSLSVSFCLFPSLHLIEAKPLHELPREKCNDGIVIPCVDPQGDIDTTFYHIILTFQACNYPACDVISSRPPRETARPLMQMRREMRRDERAGDHQVRLGLRPPGNITLISGPDFLHISLNTFWGEGGGREGGLRTCGNSWCLRWGDLGTMSGHTGSVSEYMDTPSTSFGFSQIREKQKTEEPLCSIIRLSVDLPATVLAPSVSSWSDPLSDPLCYPLCYPTTNEHCLPHI